MRKLFFSMRNILVKIDVEDEEETKAKGTTLYY